MIPTLPLRPRNRLAETILGALHDPRARAELDALAQASADRPPSGWLTTDEARHTDLLVARARRAAEALGRVPPGRLHTSLEETLRSAATLFDAGLYFEVHELLEPDWRQAAGEAREALQGLIQIAVGYQHLANGNVPGAEALLAEGAGRLARGRLPRFDFARFAREVLASRERLHAIDTEDVPRFPYASSEQ